MITRDFKLRAQRVVADYAATFISEGYFVVAKMESVSLMFYHLKHHSNGNTIIVNAKPLDNTLVMKKNGVIKVMRNIIGRTDG